MTLFEYAYLVKNIEADLVDYASRTIAWGNVGATTTIRDSNVWLLTSYLEYLVDYDVVNLTRNLLTPTQMNSFIYHIEQIINTNYNLTF